VDAEGDHFELLHVGWDGVQRVHGAVIQIDIIGDRVWIQYDGTNWPNDGTNWPIADELMAAGMPHQDIVLGGIRANCAITRASQSAEWENPWLSGVGGAGRHA
jgi:hypothetical protein